MKLFLDILFDKILIIKHNTLIIDDIDADKSSEVIQDWRAKYKIDFSISKPLTEEEQKELKMDAAENFLQNYGKALAKFRETLEVPVSNTASSPSTSEASPAQKKKIKKRKVKRTKKQKKTTGLHKLTRDLQRLEFELEERHKAILVPHKAIKARKSSSLSKKYDLKPPMRLYD